MSFLLTIAPYAVAYTFLSCCIALVLGRCIYSMNPDGDAEPVARSPGQPAFERRAKPRTPLAGALPT